MNTKLYEKITDALVKDGYIVIEDALGSQLPLALYEASLQEENYKLAGISAGLQLHTDTKKRSDKTKWLEESESVENRYLTFAKELQEYLNRSLYLGLSYYEAHFAIYEEGDFYEKHLDAFKNSKNRVVTTVLYLNKNFTKEDGGELVIYDENGKMIQEVTPKLGTLVVFLSERFPHEVKPAKSKRHSIAGWFRVDKRC